MLVALNSQFLSGLFPITASYAQNPAFYAKIPALYAKIPYFYADIYLFGFHCAGNVLGWVPVGRILSVSNDSARAMCGWGGRAVACWWKKHLRKCASEIILVRKLLCQVKARSQIPFQIQVQQGNGKAISADHAVVQPHDSES